MVPAPRPRIPDRSRAGLSLVETMMVVSLLTVVAVTVGKSFLDSSRAYSAVTLMMHTTSRAQTILDRLEAEIITGKFLSIVPVSPFKSNSLTFQKIVGVTNGVPNFGNPFHIEVFPVETNPTDGLDNNGNGLVDEEGVRNWEDFLPYGATPGAEDSPVILCTKLVQNSLHFTQQGSCIVIEMTLQEVIERGKPAKTFHFRSAVKVRN